MKRTVNITVLGKVISSLAVGSVVMGTPGKGTLLFSPRWGGGHENWEEGVSFIVSLSLSCPGLWLTESGELVLPFST